MFRTLKAIPEILAWLQIAVLPLALGSLIGFFIYAYYTNAIGLTLAIITTAAGLIAGISWANRVEKKRGALEYMSRVNASPEIDR